MKMKRRKSSVELIPLPESAATSTRCSGLGSSPATSGCLIRIQQTAGPVSMKPPDSNRYSIPVW